MSIRSGESDNVLLSFPRKPSVPPDGRFPSSPGVHGENRIQFFVGRGEKDTKLKAGDQRFYFIETL
jgi:hypothetical protein